MRSDTRKAWRMSLASWFLCTASGLLLIDLDAGPQLVALATDHGLGVLDAAGLGLILVGWLGPVLTPRRPSGTIARPTAFTGVLVAGVGAALLVSSFFIPDFAGRGPALAGTVLVVQVALAVVGSSRPRFQPPL